LGEVVPGLETTSGRGWSVLDGHRLGSLEEVDARALGEGHVRLFPVRALSRAAADTPDLAEKPARPDLLDLHLEETLDRLADLDLVRPGIDAEDDLVTELVH